jgi:hypothetical protein
MLKMIPVVSRDFGLPCVVIKILSSNLYRVFDYHDAFLKGQRLCLGLQLLNTHRGLQRILWEGKGREEGMIYETG